MIFKEEEDLRSIVAGGMNKQANIYAKPLLEVIDRLREQIAEGCRYPNGCGLHSSLEDCKRSPLVQALLEAQVEIERLQIRLSGARDSRDD